jgi:hypothetical protein
MADINGFRLELIAALLVALPLHPAVLFVGTLAEEIGGPKRTNHAPTSIPEFRFWQRHVSYWASSGTKAAYS